MLPANSKWRKLRALPKFFAVSDLRVRRASLFAVWLKYIDLVPLADPFVLAGT